MELLIVVAIVGIVVTLLGYFVIGAFVVKGNFWVSDDGALRCVQVVDPSAVRIVKLTRNISAPSVVIVEDNDGVRTTYALDSDVLWNADCTKEAGPTP